ncbi:MAG TPA: GntR family transcriptional regulator [Thermoanaerobaculia bacterium]|nr:GntR family transcriptional regulator [Thermoanaerobaculia bacterium]
MDLRADSPVPLYHQIAEHLRYAIATGALPPGERLPAVRAAAERWSVNLHTVRRAYAALAAEGLVEIRGAGGTVVRPRSGRAALASSPADAFLEEIVARARSEHHLSAADLAARLQRWPESAGGAVVHVLECSRSQAEGHAREIAAAFEIEARGAAFDAQGRPPDGPLVATYFHYNDLRVLWPAALASIRFVAIRPDPALVHRVPPPRRGARITLLLCETDPAKAESIAADLSLLLPASSYRIEPRPVRDPGELLRAKGRTPLLFSPRVWDRLRESQQADPRAIEVRYVIPREELDALARHFGWTTRRAA